MCVFVRARNCPCAYLSLCGIVLARFCRVRFYDSAVLSVQNCRERFCPVTGRNMSPLSGSKKSQARKQHEAGSRQSQLRLPGLLSTCFMLLSCLAFLRHRCWRLVPPKRRLTFTGLHGVMGDAVV
jgi:hypothetical protein